MFKLNKERGILGGTIVVSLITILSRILGLVRDLVFAKYFGTSGLADAFVVAFRIPNLLRSFVAEGALTSGFVPVFSGDLHKGRETAQQTLASTLTFITVVTFIITILGVIFSEEIVKTFAPGFINNSEKLQDCIKMTQIMFPYVICISIVALVGGALTSAKFFGTQAFSQVVMNLVMICGTIYAAFSNDAAFFLAIGATLGGVLQIILQIPSLKKAGFKFYFSANCWTPEVKQVLKLMLPAIFGAAVYQISIFISTSLASLLEEGTVSWLFYSDRLIQLPIGIFTMALATVLLPALSSSYASGSKEDYAKKLIDSLRFTTVFIFPFIVIFLAASLPIIRVLFERGSFTLYSSVSTANVCSAFALGLWGVSCHSLVVRAFIAQKDTSTTPKIGILTLILGFIISISLMGSIQSEAALSFLGNAIYSMQQFIFNLPILGTPIKSVNLGGVGLALSSAISSTIGFFILLYILKGRTPDLTLKPVFRSLKDSLIGSIVMFSVLYTAIIKTESIYLQVFWIFPAILIYIFILWIQKNPEILETFKKIPRLP